MRAVSQIVGYIRGKGAKARLLDLLAPASMESANATSWATFWTRRFFMNTVGRDKEAIQAYVRNQEKEDL